MPWDQSSITRHNKSLHGEKAGHAARIANAVLKSSGDEGMSLAVAAKWAKKHRRAGGGPAPQVGAAQTAAPTVNAQGFVPVPQGGTFNIDLTTGAMQPGSLAAMQSLAQRGLPIAGVGPAAASAAPASAATAATPGSPLTQAQQANQLAANFGPSFANAPSGGGGNARGGRAGRASGGPSPMSMGMAMPPWTRSEARGEDAVPTGLIRGPTGGRQDAVPMNLPAHSHVIPADVVSGFGQGNTDPGAVALHNALNTGPFGAGIPKVPSHGPRMGGAPKMPHLARGGEARGVRTAVSHGEVVVYPKGVQHIGGGDVNKGHDWLDRAIVDWRKQIIKRLRTLPGPVKE
jgi:hypothetical protein